MSTATRDNRDNTMSITVVQPVNEALTLQLEACGMHRNGNEMTCDRNDFDFDKWVELCETDEARDLTFQQRMN